MKKILEKSWIVRATVFNLLDQPLKTKAYVVPTRIEAARVAMDGRRHFEKFGDFADVEVLPGSLGLTEVINRRWPKMSEDEKIVKEGIDLMCILLYEHQNDEIVNFGNFGGTSEQLQRIFRESVRLPYYWGEIMVGESREGDLVVYQDLDI